MKLNLISTSVIGLLSITSCTKVIDIDLNSSRPQYIVEATVTNDNKPATVHITRSVNYSELNKYPPVTNAVVILTDDIGNIDSLRQDEAGYYQSSTISGTPGRSYTLTIYVDDHVFTSSCTMPQPVNFDSLHMQTESFFGKEITSPVVMFKDPSSLDNFYHFTVYKNERLQKGLYFEHDLVLNGIPVKFALQDVDAAYSSGDQIIVEMQCISSAMYDYYYSLQQTINQSSATPTNPVINIVGSDVTGYFSAHTVQQRSIPVQ